MKSAWCVLKGKSRKVYEIYDRSEQFMEAYKHEWVLILVKRCGKQCCKPCKWWHRWNMCASRMLLRARCALEINTWRIFVFFWGKHTTEIKKIERAKRIYVIKRGASIVRGHFLYQPRRNPLSSYMNEKKNTAVCVDARLVCACVCGNPYRCESTRKCLIFAWHHAVQNTPIYTRCLKIIERGLSMGFLDQRERCDFFLSQ